MIFRNNITFFICFRRGAGKRGEESEIKKRKTKKKSIRTTMRPQGYISYRNIYIYLDYSSFPDDFGWFRRFFLNGYGRTYRYTDQRTYGYTDIRTNRPSYRDASTHLKMRHFSFRAMVLASVCLCNCLRAYIRRRARKFPKWLRMSNSCSRNPPFHFGPHRVPLVGSLNFPLSWN